MTRRNHIMLLALGLIALAGVGVWLVCWAAGSAPGVGIENVKLIRAGMTQADVERLLGPSVAVDNALGRHGSASWSNGRGEEFVILVDSTGGVMLVLNTSRSMLTTVPLGKATVLDRLRRWLGL